MFNFNSMKEEERFFPESKLLSEREWSYKNYITDYFRMSEKEILTIEPGEEISDMINEERKTFCPDLMIYKFLDSISFLPEDEEQVYKLFKYVEQLINESDLQKTESAPLDLDSVINNAEKTRESNLFEEKFSVDLISDNVDLSAEKFDNNENVVSDMLSEEVKKPESKKVNLLVEEIIR